MDEFRGIQTALFLMMLLPFTGAAALTVRDGDEVTLPCISVRDDQNNCDRTIWFYSGSSSRAAELVTDGQISEQAKDKSDRLSVTENCSLVIKKVTEKEDDGQYACRQIRSGQEQDETVFLSVVTMTEQKNSDEVTLTCSVSIYRVCRHTVKWLFEGQDVDEVGGDLKTSQSDCSASVTFRMSHYIQTSSYQSLKCEATDDFTRTPQLFPFRLSGEETTPESPTTESPTPESPTPQSPTPESPKPESPTTESPTPESPKPESPTPESPTPESPKPESPTPESPTPESPKPESPTPESPTPESPKPESPTPESPTPESPKPESPTPESPTPESPKPESPTPESPTPDSPTTESPTPESPTPESPTTESPKPESPTPESSTTESPTPKSPTPESPTTTSGNSTATALWFIFVSVALAALIMTVVAINVWRRIKEKKTQTDENTVRYDADDDTVNYENITSPDGV